MRSARPGAMRPAQPGDEPDRQRRHAEVRGGAAGQRQRAEHEHRALGRRLGALEQQPADRADREADRRAARARRSTPRAARRRAAAQRPPSPRTIGSTSSRSATRVATAAAGSESGSADVADDADAQRPSASANRGDGRAERQAGRAREVDRGAGDRDDRDDALEAGGDEQTQRRANLAAERDADEHAEHRERDRHRDVETREDARRQQSETARTEQRAERQEDRPPA